MENDIKFIKAKERFAKEIKSLRKMEDIVNEFIRRRKSFDKYYPEIKQFEDYLLIFKPKMVSSRKDKALDLYNYNTEKMANSDSDGHIAGYKVPGFLGVSEKIFKKILSLGLIVPAGYTSFRKWGKDLKTPYFSYDLLYKIKQEKLDDFILSAEGFANQEDKSKWIDIVDEITNNHSLVLKNTSWHKIILLKSIGYEFSERVDVRLNDKNFMKADLDKIKKKIDAMIPKFIERELVLNERLDRILDDNLITSDELKNLTLLTEGLCEDKLFEAVSEKIKQIHYQRELSKTELVLDLKNYQNSFRLARSMKRKINFVVGPTNSGKTFQALQTLTKADTGLYLAPLRLMALEVYESLNKAGVPCNLITGEEHIIIPNAKHTSSTIECLSLKKTVDCAVIDEIQVISDPERGWAWTNALLGVPAKEVFAVGNTSALNKSIELIDRVGDDYEVFHKERLSKLSAIKHISFNDLKKGDALIAFSKKKVLEYAIKLRESGKKVSIIYGALSPEVRMRQAHLFYTGVNDILVSTDAIGMGLNLPIDRVIFSQLSKYDGKSNRSLNETEIKQIGGRAGRFDSNGYVGMLDTCYASDIIEHSLPALERPIERFPISLNKWHVSIIRDMLKTDSIEKILKIFPVLCNSDDFYSLDNETLLFIGKYIDKKFDIKAEDKLKFCFTPIDIKSDRQVGFFYYIMQIAFLANQEIKFPKYDNFKKNGTFDELSRAEEELKLMTMFKYLAKYSENINLDGIDKRKAFLESFIFKTLLSVKLPKVAEHYYDEYFYY